VAFRVPEARGIMVTLASVLPEHKRVAINLVREVQGRGLRDAFRLVEKVLAGTPEMLATGVSVDRAGELVTMFTPVGSVTCAPA
jgi:ribosomal protein L7/L12